MPRHVLALFAAALLTVSLAPARAQPGPSHWRPATREGRALFREAKQLRQSPTGNPAAARQLLHQASRQLNTSNLDAAFKANHLISDALHLGGKSLSSGDQQLVRFLASRTARAMMSISSGDYGHPGDAFSTARTVLALPGIGPAERKAAGELAGKALIRLLDYFVHVTTHRTPSDIAAFRDGRAKSGSEIGKLARLELPWSQSLAPSVKAAQARALALINSPAFARFVAEGSPSTPAALHRAAPPRNAAELKQLLAMPIQHLSDVRRLEQLLARSSSLKLGAPERIGLAGDLTRLARQAAEQATQHARFQGHSIERPEDASHFMKSRVADRYTATLKRLNNRFALLGAPPEARQLLERATNQINTLGIALDPALASDKLYQREVRKNLPRY